MVEAPRAAWRTEGGDGQPADGCVDGVAAEGKRTRREEFLAEMDAVIPWPRLLALIEPPYPQARRGRPPGPRRGIGGLSVRLVTRNPRAVTCAELP